VRPLARAR